MKKNCSGCGIELQCTDEKGSGFIPEKTLLKDGKSYCQRCFKVTHYGDYLPVDMSREDYKVEVNSTIKKANIAVAIFDIIDFEGSFDDEILDILREIDSIIVINKLDLIPGDKHPSEVASWVKERLGDEGIVPLDIAITSSKSGYGINGIIKKLKYFLPKYGTAVILGTTNVGKSSVLNKLLGEKRSTISKYPGTTLKSIPVKIPKTDITIIDTPGLIPEGRVSDLVCQSCNLDIIPSTEISRKTFKVKNDRIISLGALITLKVLKSDTGSAIFSLFASKGVKFHETNPSRIDDILDTHLDLDLTPPCEVCAPEFKKIPRIKETFTLDVGEELVFKGLGWISVKRGPLSLEVDYPEGSEVLIRDAFITPRRDKKGGK